MFRVGKVTRWIWSWDRVCRHDRGTQDPVVHLVSETLRGYVDTEQLQEGAQVWAPSGNQLPACPENHLVLIEGEWLYTVVLVSAAQKHESTIIIYTPPPFEPSSPHPICLDHLRVSGWPPCVMQQLLTSYLFHMIVYICQQCFLNSSHPSSPCCYKSHCPIAVTLFLP